MTATPSRVRYTTLDPWRGLACLLVIVYHSTMVSRSLAGPDWTAGYMGPLAGWVIAQTRHFDVGVALFFVISGYCIAAAADGVRRKGGRVSQYSVRRVRRIYPPYWIVVACSVLFFVFDFWPWRGLLSSDPWAQLRPNWYAPSQWIGNLTLTETWRSHLWGAQRGHFPGQAWTLCYEEQFYLVMGLLIAFRPSALFAGTLVVTALTAATAVFAHLLPFAVEGFFFDGSWLLFAAGVAVYYQVVYATDWGRRLLYLSLVAAIAASLVVSIPIAGATVGFAFAALLPALYPFDERLSHALAVRWLAVPGRMCYSLYLVHQIPVKAISAVLYRAGVHGAWPTMLITIPACVVVSLVLGWVFHVQVERRFLNAPQPEVLARSTGEPELLSKEALPVL